MLAFEGPEARGYNPLVSDLGSPIPGFRSRVYDPRIDDPRIGDPRIGDHGPVSVGTSVSELKFRAGDAFLDIGARFKSLGDVVHDLLDHRECGIQIFLAVEPQD